MISELLKAWCHNGERPRISFWRDRTGREVDALLDFPGARVPLEAKAGGTLTRIPRAGSVRRGPRSPLKRAVESVIGLGRNTHETGWGIT